MCLVTLVLHHRRHEGKREVAVGRGHLTGALIGGTWPQMRLGEDGSYMPGFTLLPFPLLLGLSIGQTQLGGKRQEGAFK